MQKVECLGENSKGMSALLFAEGLNSIPVIHGPPSSPREIPKHLARELLELLGMVQ